MYFHEIEGVKVDKFFFPPGTTFSTLGEYSQGLSGEEKFCANILPRAGKFSRPGRENISALAFFRNVVAAAGRARGTSEFFVDERVTERVDRCVKIYAIDSNGAE